MKCTRLLYRPGDGIARTVASHVISSDRLHRRSRDCMSYYDLGAYSRQITTTSPEAQTWFDRGLNWFFGFNHEEGISASTRRWSTIPTAPWPIGACAYAAGPELQPALDRYDPHGKANALAASYDAMQKALAVRRAGRSPVEQALIKALPARYPQREPIEDSRAGTRPSPERCAGVRAASAPISRSRCVFVEAIMNETPWQMWNLDTGGVAEGRRHRGSDELLGRRSTTCRRPGTIPACCISTCISWRCRRSRSARCAPATGCATWCPNSGHLVHMPTHIDVLCGQLSRRRRL